MSEAERKKIEMKRSKSIKTIRRQTLSKDKIIMREEEKVFEMKPEPITDEEWASLLVGERDIKNISKDRLR